MRIYNNLSEAISEVRRELAEMGILTKRYFQSQKVEINTKEIIGYGFKVKIDPEHLINSAHNKYVDLTECNIEAERRFTFDTNNLFKTGYNKEIFETLAVEYKGEKLLNYDYVERITNQFCIALLKLTNNINSRQQIISIWEKSDLIKSENFRVPCSIYYHLMIQNNKLNLSYIMRSSDVMTHFPNDLTIAALLLLKSYNYLKISHNDLEFGNLIFYSDNLHEYQDKLEGVF